jgi:hypothetical protein
MIVQPAPLGSSSRRRRALRTIGLLLPVVLLGVVVGVGLATPAPSPPPDRTATPTAVVADTTQDRSPAPEGIAVSAPVFPRDIAGLQVHGVRWTLEARSRGLARGVIAVAGYLGLVSSPRDCRGQLGAFGPFCARTGVLGERPWTAGPLTETELQPYHLHPQFPVGVSVPGQIPLATGAAGVPSPPVILIARFDDSRAERCVPEGRHCGQELVVERVAWVDGNVLAVAEAVDPGIDAQTLATTEVPAFRTMAYPLLSAYVLPALLERIDPVAATQAGATGPVWYLRGLVGLGEPDQIEWSVIDLEHSTLLADGSIDTSRFPAGGTTR